MNQASNKARSVRCLAMNYLAATGTVITPVFSTPGSSVLGGTYSYRLDSDMKRGFAVIGWPTTDGDSGVMSFMFSHDGQVFEKNLGANGV